MKHILESWRGIIHDYAVVAALAAGATWAVTEFYLTTKPAIVIHGTCTPVAQADGRALMRPRVDVGNRGRGRKTYEAGSFLLIQLNNLRPLETVLEALPSGGVDLLALRGVDDAFGLLAEASHIFSANVTIEPGDTEHYYFHFLLDASLDVFSAYMSTRTAEGVIIEKGVFEICSTQGERETLDMRDVDARATTSSAAGPATQQQNIQTIHQRQRQATAEQPPASGVPDAGSPPAP